jgi:hypothetical protein
VTLENDLVSEIEENRISILRSLRGSIILIKKECDEILTKIGDALPWRVCLAGTNGKVVYAASKTKNSAQIAVKRLNNSEEDVD